MDGPSNTPSAGTLLADIEKQVWKAEANFDENLKGVLERCAEALRQSAQDTPSEAGIVWRSNPLSELPVGSSSRPSADADAETYETYAEWQQKRGRMADKFDEVRCILADHYEIRMQPKFVHEDVHRGAAKRIFEALTPDASTGTSADADVVELRADLHEFWEHLPDKNEEAAELFGRLDAALAKLDAKKGEG